MKLPIRGLLVEIWQSLARDAAALVPLLGLPLALLVVFDVIAWWEEGRDVPGWIASLLSWLLSVLIAIALHRALLRGRDSLTARDVWRWGRREWQFFLNLILVGMITVAPIMVFGAGFGSLLVAQLPEPLSQPVSILIWGASAALGGYLSARLSLVLPAIAVEHAMARDHAAIWALTRGNGWRLAVLVWTPTLIFMPLGFLVDIGMPEWADMFLNEFVAVGLALYDVAVLSLSFRRLAAYVADAAAA